MRKVIAGYNRQLIPMTCSSSYFWL